MEYEIPAEKGAHWEYQNLEDYKKLRRESIFRLENFYKTI